jgi:hypothetical protein
VDDPISCLDTSTLKGYPHIMDVPGYGISSSWKLCISWGTIVMRCKPNLFLATLKIKVCLLFLFLPSNHLLLQKIALQHQMPSVALFIVAIKVQLYPLQCC